MRVGAEEYKGPVAPPTADPTWGPGECTCIFTLHHLSLQSLHVSVHHHGGVTRTMTDKAGSWLGASSTSLLGARDVPLRFLASQPECDRTFELHIPGKAHQTSGDRDCGEIRIAFRWMPFVNRSSERRLTGTKAKPIAGMLFVEMEEAKGISDPTQAQGKDATKARPAPANAFVRFRLIKMKTKTDIDPPWDAAEVHDAHLVGTKGTVRETSPVTSAQGKAWWGENFEWSVKHEELPTLVLHGEVLHKIAGSLFKRARTVSMGEFCVPLRSLFDPAGLRSAHPDIQAMLEDASRTRYPSVVAAGGYSEGPNGTVAELWRLRETSRTRTHGCFLPMDLGMKVYYRPFEVE
mmetsp:Transcript_41871/g.95429  ORF Transcript_41871/g.95429 Transcript_41871/m.95429 type:complete len:349 (-) Transcript_41871:13-1059(-)